MTDAGNITIQSVFERFLPMIADRTFSNEQFNAIRCIRNCRTAEMGAHVSECESCHATFIHYNSCKNRHCPMCQGMDVDEWIDLRREDVLDAPYFHTVRYFLFSIRFHPYLEHFPMYLRIIIHIYLLCINSRFSRAANSDKTRNHIIIRYI